VLVGFKDGRGEGGEGARGERVRGTGGKGNVRSVGGGTDGEGEERRETGRRKRKGAGKRRTVSELFGVDGVLGEGVLFCMGEVVGCGCGCGRCRGGRWVRACGGHCGVFGGGLLWWLGRDFEGPEDW
jgi:hypothetical protein